MKKIKILTQTYNIVESPVITHGEALYGMIDYFKNEIHICSDVSKERKKVTLIHETLHSIFEQLGFKEENDNEHLIESLSVSLYQVLEENRELFLL